MIITATNQASLLIIQAMEVITRTNGILPAGIPKAITILGKVTTTPNIMAYKYTNNKGQDYYLHSKNVHLRSGCEQLIYYFAREVKAEAMNQIPEGFVVVENKRTGLPVLKKS